jgi:hypothetical protein
MAIVACMVRFIHRYKVDWKVVCYEVLAFLTISVISLQKIWTVNNPNLDWLVQVSIQVCPGTRGLVQISVQVEYWTVNTVQQ